jgi:hypothetical protein
MRASSKEAQKRIDVPALSAAWKKYKSILSFYDESRKVECVIARYVFVNRVRKMRNIDGTYFPLDIIGFVLNKDHATILRAERLMDGGYYKAKQPIINICEEAAAKVLSVMEISINKVVKGADFELSRMAAEKLCINLEKIL